MQSLHNVNFDNYGYTMGSPFQDLIINQRSIGNVSNMGDQGLSPPYSNQSPPHSVQSNIALSPQAYIGKFQTICPIYLFSQIQLDVQQAQLLQCEYVHYELSNIF